MRIVSLLPSATEILFAIDAGDDVVGVTHECDFPDAARSRPHLTSSALPSAGNAAEIDRHVRAGVHAGSSLYHLDSNLLERLQPDLIVTQELCAVCAVSYEIVARAARRLAGDLRIISLEPSALDDVYANIATLGELTKHKAEALALVERLRERACAVGDAAANRPKPRALVLEWTDPPMSGGHWTPGLVELAGGIPVLAHPGANSQTLAWDDIAAADPDAIVVAPCGFDLERARRATDDLTANGVWRSLRAVRAGNVWVLDGNAYLNRPGPRLVDTAELLAHCLHPDHDCTAARVDPNALERCVSISADRR
ncbi:MAG: ABC transporter substrate-binding protein [Vulcanimicrobiaceae bacterium]